MASSSIIKHKDISIVFTDISDAAPDEAVRAFDHCQQIISELPLNSVYSLVNAKNARFNSDLIQKIKDTVKKNNPHNRATAVSGLNQLSRLMVKSITTFTGREIKLTDTVDEAKDWLYEKSRAAVSP